MAIFYVLPPRPVVSDALAHLLRGWLPGLRQPEHVGRIFTEALQLEYSAEEDVFLVFREDLPDGEEPARALADGYGAEPGDEIVELRFATHGEVRARSWRLGAA